MPELATRCCWTACHREVPLPGLPGRALANDTQADEPICRLPGRMLGPSSTSAFKARMHAAMLMTDQQQLELLWKDGITVAYNASTACLCNTRRRRKNARLKSREVCTSFARVDEDCRVMQISSFECRTRIGQCLPGRNL